MTDDQRKDYEERLRDEFKDQLEEKIDEAVEEWRGDSEVLYEARASARQALMEEIERGLNGRFEQSVEEGAEDELDAEEPDVRERCEEWLRAQFEHLLETELDTLDSTK